MKLLLRILLLFIVAPALGQEKGSITYITRDSLPYNLEEHWLFHQGDDSAWAAPGFNDSAWQPLDIQLSLKQKADKKFKGIGWFRLHLHVDSSLAGVPMTLALKHYGASVIYIDGKKVKAYGKVGHTEELTDNYNPNSEPLILPPMDTGMHVIAVRYSIHFAEKLWEGGRVNPGVSMAIDRAQHFVDQYINKLQLIGVFLLTLAGFFLALTVSHMFMWLYNRSTKANLYFSIYCFATAVMFSVPVASTAIHHPRWGYISFFTSLSVAVIMCVTLSGVSNTLFAQGRKRFRAIAAMGLIPLLLAYYAAGLAAVVTIGIMIVVTIESIILTARAIYKRIPGARIVGVGILFFTLFIFTIVSISLVNQGLQVEDEWKALTLIGLAIAAFLSIPVSMSIYIAWNYAKLALGLETQLQQVQLLSEKTLQQEMEKQHYLETEKDRLETEVELRTREIVSEKKKSDELLLNILPEEVAEELKQKGTSGARYFDHVSVMFTDFVDFTKAGEKFTPQQLVDELDTCFKAFDDIISRYGIEKIKTIGDAYLAVCGLPAAVDDHATKTVMAARDILHYMKERKASMPDQAFDIRIGIHSGSVVAGIVGVKKFAYDIWGDTVNTAARMEQSGVAGHINISQTTYNLVKDKFRCSYRGEIAAKNKGDMDMYFVEEAI